MAACATPAPQPTPTESPQKVVKLLQKLDDLLLLSGEERELWEELKVEVGKLSPTPKVTADNDHIQKLTEAVTDLINKQNFPAKPITPRSYAAALQTGLPS